MHLHILCKMLSLAFWPFQVENDEILSDLHICVHPDFWLVWRNLSQFAIFWGLALLCCQQDLMHIRRAQQQTNCSLWWTALTPVTSIQHCHAAIQKLRVHHRTKLVWRTEWNYILRIFLAVLRDAARFLRYGFPITITLMHLQIAITSMGHKVSCPTNQLLEIETTP